VRMVVLGTVRLVHINNTVLKTVSIQLIASRLWMLLHLKIIHTSIRRSHWHLCLQRRVRLLLSLYVLK
jgi:hypothetical protein